MNSKLIVAVEVVWLEQLVGIRKVRHVGDAGGEDGHLRGMDKVG